MKEDVNYNALYPETKAMKENPKLPEEYYNLKCKEQCIKYEHEEE